MLQGIICPIMTPITEEGALNTAGLKKLIEHVIAGGVDAVLVAGTNGEFFCLSDRNWLDLVTQSLSTIGRRKPTIVNVSHCSLHEAIRRARYVQEHGADYIASTPPYYFGLSNDEVAAYYLGLADASSLPLLLYNIPQFTKSDVYAIIPRLAEHPNIVGIKDSSGLYDRMVGSRRRMRRAFTYLVGSDVLLEETLLSHLDGIVPGLSNLVPGLYHEWWQALRSGDRAVAQACQEKIFTLTALYEKASSAVPFLQVVRYGLRAIGLNIGEPCSPIGPLPISTQQLIERTLDDLGLRRAGSSEEGLARAN